MSFKTLHQFTVYLDRPGKKTTERVEGGKTIVETEDVIESVPHVIVLKEPSRRERYDVGLFQSVSQNEGVAMGLMPRLLMIQQLDKLPGNRLSGDTEQSLAAMNARMQEIANDYIRLGTQAGSESPEIAARKEQLDMEYRALNKKSDDLNTAYQSVFAHTAEQYAQNKVITWLTLFLTYVKTPDGKHEPLFTGADFKAKEECLGDLEDSENKLYFAALDKLSFYWMLYYFGRAATSADYLKIEAEQAKQLEAAQKMKAEEEAKAKAVAEAAVVTPPVVADTAATETLPVLVTPTPETPQS